MTADISKEIGEFIADDILDDALNARKRRITNFENSFEYRAMLSQANEVEDSRQRLMYPEFGCYCKSFIVIDEFDINF